MRRLLRWTFNALAAASLLLCVATAGLWVRSYWAKDQLYDHGLYAPVYAAEHRQCYVWSDHGRLAGWLEWTERPDGSPTPPREGDVGDPDLGQFRYTGSTFAFDANRYVYADFTVSTRAWGLPHWSLVAAFAVLPAIFVFRRVRAVRRRRRRAHLGLCPVCRYDLRATPERCPECGREGG